VCFAHTKSKFHQKKKKEFKLDLIFEDYHMEAASGKQEEENSLLLDGFY
jgi:hypothetical protein